MTDDRNDNRHTPSLHISDEEAINVKGKPPYDIEAFAKFSDDEFKEATRDLTHPQLNFEEYVRIFYLFVHESLCNNTDKSVKKSAEHLIERLNITREKVWKEGDAKFDAVAEAFFVGKSLEEFLHSEAISVFRKTGRMGSWEVIDLFDIAMSSTNRKKALLKQVTRANLLAEALTFVNLDLDKNCNPEWEHVDYVNKIIKNPRFNEKDKNGKFVLSENSLRKEIRELFRTRFRNHGPNYRLSKGQARHVSRPANRPSR